MKKYILTLKGTKKNNTQDIKVEMTCDNKSQAFSLAYQFFQKGETNVVYGSKERGFSTIHRWMHNAEQMKKYAGKYIVYSTSVKAA